MIRAQWSEYGSSVIFTNKYLQENNPMFQERHMSYLRNKKTLNYFLLFLLLALPTKANILSKGEAVITCFSGYQKDSNGSFSIPARIDPSGYVLAVVDVRDRSTAPPQTMNTSWLANAYHHPDWTAKKLGQIFGLAIDRDGAIYTTATTVYGDFRPIGTDPQPEGAFGIGGPGAVYRIHPITGTVSVFKTLPNKDVGLGNVAYDPIYHQLFVSNLQDGMIYRIPIVNGISGNAAAGSATEGPCLPSGKILCPDSHP